MIHLEKLTYENFDDVFELKVKKDQYGFVASNCYSVAEAYVTLINGGQVFPFAIYNDDRPVGFIQIAYGENADQDGVQWSWRCRAHRACGRGQRCRGRRG